MNTGPARGMRDFLPDDLRRRQYVMGVIAEALDLRGPGLTVGGASASGNVAVGVALDLIRCGRADACLVVGPMPALSPVERQALTAMGALAAPGQLCRPFDRAARGFVPRAAFPDTAPIVDDSVDLLEGSGGDVYVVGPREVHLLRRRAAAGATRKDKP